jgi:D-psicose/D-tagatose/L-ribulose 3-epimerase
MTAPMLSRISVSNIAWVAEEDEAVAALLVRRGVMAIEVAPGRLFADPITATTAEIEKIRAFWSGHGIRIAAMQGLLFGRPEFALFADDSARDAMSDYLRRVIALAGQLGCGPLVFGSPTNRRRGPLSLDEAYRRAADFFRPLAEFAHDHRCVLCFEPNASAYGCDFVQKLSEAAVLAQRVAHPAFGVQLDVGNFMMEHDEIADVRAAALLIGHCHASAPNLSLLGEAPTLLGSVVAAANAGGYRGLISIEMRRPAGRSVIAAVERALDYVSETVTAADD